MNSELNKCILFGLFVFSSPKVSICKFVQAAYLRDLCLVNLESERINLLLGRDVPDLHWIRKQNKCFPRPLRCTHEAGVGTIWFLGETYLVD